jgi:hypothetical protein
MSDLPVDRARLKKQFPALTDGDIEAYETVTQRILGQKSPAERGRLTRTILETARSARDRGASGATLTEDERLSVRYLDAVAKMQGTTVRRS